jgi:hypothetical protein
LKSIQDVQIVLQAYLSPHIYLREDTKKTIMIVTAPKEQHEHIKWYFKKRMHISMPILFEEPSKKMFRRWKRYWRKKLFRAFLRGDSID